MNNKGSIGITMLCCCFMLGTLISILYLMGHETHRFAVNAAISNNLKYVNEYYLVSASKMLESEETVDKIFLLDDNIYTIDKIKENDVSCDIQGIKNGDTIILMGEAREKNIVNRVYVELDKQGDRYVSRYWNY